MTLPPALAALAPYAQFITYRLAPHPTIAGKTLKQPCDWRSGRVCTAHDPNVWADHETAAANAYRADIGHGCGAGFVFTALDPFWFIDVDAALRPDGTWSPGAIALAHRLAGAATETSLSGTGFHIIGTGACPSHSAANEPFSTDPTDGSAALYTEKRFVALTLANLSGDAATDHTATMQLLVPERFSPRAGAVAADGEWTTEPDEGYDTRFADDQHLLTCARKARSAATAFGTSATFAQLWDADDTALARCYPPDGAGAYNASAADQALATRLAYWTGRDCERIRRLMEDSALRREKWERHATYLETTILKARALVASIPRPQPDPPPVTVPPSPDAPEQTARVIALTHEQAHDKTNHLAIEYWLAAGGGAPIRYDEFADTVRIGDTPLTDHVERRMWLAIREVSETKFAWDLFDHTVRDIAWQARYHPLREYLAARQTEWDGAPRIDRWMTDYLGVPDEPYTRSIGALFLTALVRRARLPGAKFDEMIVLEGPQGVEKSTALAALCEREEWFTDEVSVGMTSKELLEITAGKWIVEAPELKGLVGRGVDHVKAFLARRVDRARMSYDRNPTERGRQWVAAATTNEDAYLDDPTGNRRIWPVRVAEVRLDALRAMRGQLWAEAAVREATGVPIRMPRELWAIAAQHQADRLITDSFKEALEDRLGDKTGRVRGKDVLDALRVPLERQPALARKFGEAMRSLGWTNKTVTVDGVSARYFVKGDQARAIVWSEGDLVFSPPLLKIV